VYVKVEPVLVVEWWWLFYTLRLSYKLICAMFLTKFWKSPLWVVVETSHDRVAGACDKVSRVA